MFTVFGDVQLARPCLTVREAALQLRSLHTVYEDVWHSMTYGFADHRYARPGSIVDKAAFQQWKSNIVENIPGMILLSSQYLFSEQQPGKSEMPEHLWLYFYQRCLDTVGK